MASLSQCRRTWTRLPVAKWLVWLRLRPVRTATDPAVAVIVTDRHQFLFRLLHNPVSVTVVVHPHHFPYLPPLPHTWMDLHTYNPITVWTTSLPWVVVVPRSGVVIIVEWAPHSGRHTPSEMPPTWTTWRTKFLHCHSHNHHLWPQRHKVLIPMTQRHGWVIQYRHQVLATVMVVHPLLRHHRRTQVTVTVDLHNRQLHRTATVDHPLLQ